MFEGKQIDPCRWLLQDMLGSVEESQAFHILMEGHARGLFEDAAQMIRRKMDSRGDLHKPQMGMNVGIEISFDRVRLFHIGTQGIFQLLLPCRARLIYRTDNFISRENDLFLQPER